MSITAKSVPPSICIVRRIQMWPPRSGRDESPSRALSCAYPPPDRRPHPSPIPQILRKPRPNSLTPILNHHVLKPDPSQQRLVRFECLWPLHEVPSWHTQYRGQNKVSQRRVDMWWWQDIGISDYAATRAKRRKDGSEKVRDRGRKVVDRIKDVHQVVRRRCWGGYLIRLGLGVVRFERRLGDVALAEIAAHGI